ncbi:MAG: M28 family peptidase [Thermoanaerobaculum sp.]|nr:M28 family peptidase [Thermoanaerobaculum sp.]
MRLLMVTAAVSFWVQQASAQPWPRLQPGAEGELRAHVRFLASDLLEGRAPGSRGGQLARAYLAAQLEAWGYLPAGDGGSFEQAVPMVGIHTQPPERWVFSGSGGQLALEHRRDFVVFSGLQQETVKVGPAELVFVGYGIQAPEYGWDDFKGVDVRGKLLVVLNNDPHWDPQLFAGETRLYYGRWSYKYEMAAKLGAAGALIIHTTPSAGYPWPVVVSSWGGEQFELPAGGEPRVPVKGWLTEEAAKRIFALGGQSYEALLARAQSRQFRPQPMGVSTTLSLRTNLRQVMGANVLGLWPGSDERLREEVVVLTAHHDHLGVGSPEETGDRIYNGARDNAAGCAQVLVIARALAHQLPRPKRSVLVAFVEAEEYGLLGSAFLAAHPPVPPGRLAAVVNYDGGNIWGRTRDVAQIGRGKSTLDQVLEQAAAHQGRVVVGDPFPDRGSFYRSDHFSLARIGVPGLYFRSGTDYIGKPPGWGKQQAEAWEAVHYHRPSDQLTPQWDFSGMVEDAELGLWCVLAIANNPHMPQWVPGDEFFAARARALEALSQTGKP